MERRSFIKNSALVSAATMVPRFLQGAIPNSLDATNGRILIVVQLAGGNDGLNTIIPFRNDIYFKLRPKLAIPNSPFKLNEELALHPKMESLQRIYDDGDLSILNSVGYPNPNRSHFRSMDIWQSGSSADEYLSTGWLGRYLDANCPLGKAHDAIELSQSLSLALKGHEHKGLAFSNINRLYKTAQSPVVKKFSRSQPSPGNTEVDFLYKTLSHTTQSAEYLHEHHQSYQATGSYPQHNFGTQMKTVAELINSGCNSTIYYVTLSGFDTHAGQNNFQPRLLDVYSKALLAMQTDLKKTNRWKDTLVMTFSEFGRRTAENASGGTDHGAANVMFLAGGSLKRPGVFNEAPNLKELEEGDIKHKIDFRQVYATVFEKWLHASGMDLNSKFRVLDVI